jgi:hypothetical protein
MKLRNKAGQMAIVVPFEGAAGDIQAHGGKIVTAIKFGSCGLGEPAWSTEPVLLDGFGNTIGWDDRDLKPLPQEQAPIGHNSHENVDSLRE